MTTEETTPAPAESESTDLAVQHKAFKDHAVEVLNTWAQAQDHCFTYDEIMERVGLNGRDRYYASWGHPARGIVVGEDTDEAFQTWKADAERLLYTEAKRHGIYDFDAVMVEAGFKVRAEVFNETDVVIEGSFKVPVTVEVGEGQNLIDAITNQVLRQVRDALYGNFDSVATWKAVVADEG